MVFIFCDTLNDYDVSVLGVCVLGVCDQESLISSMSL